jgi:hypothetical protein
LPPPITFPHRGHDNPLHDALPTMRLLDGGEKHVDHLAHKHLVVFVEN